MNESMLEVLIEEAAELKKERDKKRTKILNEKPWMSPAGLYHECCVEYNNYLNAVARVQMLAMYIKQIKGQN